MFGYRHYVPVLRWKRAEWIALRGLKPEHRKHMTPLIELTPKKFTLENQHIIDQLLRRAFLFRHTGIITACCFAAPVGHVSIYFRSS